VNQKHNNEWSHKLILKVNSVSSTGQLTTTLHSHFTVDYIITYGQIRRAPQSTL